MTDSSSTPVSLPAGVPPTGTKDLGPPFLFIPLLPNLRDVGTTAPVTSQVLYRAADPSHVSSDGLATLHGRHRITTIFDLRSEPEIINAGGVADWEERIRMYNESSGARVKRHWTPVFKAEDYGPEAVAMRFRDYGDADSTRGFVRAYEAILEHGAGAFGTIIRHIASAGDGSGTLVHCTAGKDRTGVLVAVVLRLVGVDAGTVAAEYELTERGLAERRPYLIGRLVGTGAFGEGEEARAAAERMTGSRRESMLATLDFLEGKYGSVERYVREICRVDDAVVEALRRRFTRSGPGAAGQAVL